MMVGGQIRLYDHTRVIRAVTGGKCRRIPQIQNDLFLASTLTAMFIKLQSLKSRPVKERQHMTYASCAVRDSTYVQLKRQVKTRNQNSDGHCAPTAYHNSSPWTLPSVGSLPVLGREFESSPTSPHTSIWSRRRIVLDDFTEVNAPLRRHLATDV